MNFNMPLEVPDTGAVFTFGKSRFADNLPSYFFVKNDPIIDVSCGDEHTIVVCSKGRIFSFGRNAHGELGLGHRCATSRPNCVKGLKSHKTKSVACGGAHTLVLTEDGQVFSCGKNDDGQLGLNDYEDRDNFEPVQFESSIKIRQVSAGFCHSACIDEKGQLYLWGSNRCAQLGLESNAYSSLQTPTRLLVQHECAQVACGYYHTLILTEDGEIWSFGEGEYGKLGNHESSEPKINPKPTQIEVDVSFIYIDAGGNHSGAISREGDVYVWGANDVGQLGIEELDGGNISHPVKIPLKKKVTHLSLGENHSAVVTEHGELYTFGDNRHGKAVLDRNNGAKIDRLSIPTRVNKLQGLEVSHVSCGGCHTMVLASRRPALLDTISIDSSDDSVFVTGKSSLPPLQRRSPASTISASSPLSFSQNSLNIKTPPSPPPLPSSPPLAESEDYEKEKNEMTTSETIRDNDKSNDSADECCQTASEEYLDKSINCKMEDLVLPDENAIVSDSFEDKKTPPKIKHILLEKLNLSLPKSELKVDKKEKTEKKVSKTCVLL